MRDAAVGSAGGPVVGSGSRAVRSASGVLARLAGGQRGMRLTPVVLAGLLGATAVAASGLFDPRLANGVPTLALVDLHGWTHARHVEFALAFGGQLVLTLAWMLLGLRVRGHRDGIKALVLAAGVWALPFLFTAPLFSNDAWSYIADGHLVARGLSPYVATPADLAGPIVHAVSTRWVHTTSPYGPLAMVWGGLVTHVSAKAWFDLLGFRLLAVLGLALLAWYIPRLARGSGRDPVAATWLVVPSPVLLAHGIGGAHLDLAMAGLMVAGLFLAQHGRWMAAAVLVGAAAAIKAPAVVADVGVVLASLAWADPGPHRWRARAGRAFWTFAVSALTIELISLLGGLGTGWVRGLSTPLATTTPLSLSSVAGQAVGAVTGHPWVGGAHLTGLAVLAALMLVTLLRTSTSSTASGHRAMAILMTMTVLLSPIVHYWYVLWCLPLLAYAPLGRAWRRVATALAVALSLLAPLDLSKHLPDGRTVMYAVLAVALALALVPSVLPRSRHGRRA